MPWFEGVVRLEIFQKAAYIKLPGCTRSAVPGKYVSATFQKIEELFSRGCVFLEGTSPGEI